MKAKLAWWSLVVLWAGLQSGMATDADLAGLAAANNGFAFKLLYQLAAEQPDQNIFISPYSAATALQMAANGAAGQTRTEMEQVLGTANLSPEAVNEASRTAAGLLNSMDTNLVLTTADALWYRQGAVVKPSFLAANHDFFQATAQALDFNNVPAAEGRINQWASDQTHGRITGIADGMITPMTDLILANAIYFKGKWADPFDAKQTRERPFHPAAGPEKNLPMMQMSKKFMYRKGSGYQAVQLPYVGDDLAMYVFLPDAGSSLGKLLQVLNGDRWRRVTMPGFNECDGFLVLPKFKLENTQELNMPLMALGMKSAFSRSADFSGMFDDPHHISEVRQKAFVDVNEEGTEAAAVTTIGMQSLSMMMPPSRPFEMIVDRPFLFAIVDARSEMILFLGTVNGL